MSDELAESRDELFDLLRLIEWHHFDPGEGPSFELRPVTNEGWVYFARAKGTHMVKVGHTTAEHPQARIDGLQTGCPHDLVLEDAFCASAAFEKSVHEHISHRHIRGEWFELSETEVRLSAEAGWAGYCPFSCPKCGAVREKGYGGICIDCSYDAHLAQEEAKKAAASE